MAYEPKDKDGFKWTKKNMARLMEYKKTKTNQEIANIFKISLNSVIGKLRRIKKDGGVENSKPAKVSKVSRNIGYDHLSTRAQVSKKICKPLLELKPRECRFPSGDPNDADFSFCGEPSLKHMPYCREHYNLCYQRPKKLFGASPVNVIDNVADNATIRS